MLARLETVRRGVASRVSRMGPLASDGVLYGTSALFATLLALTSTQAAQWHWGYLAAGPYAAVGFVAVLAARRSHRLSEAGQRRLRVALLGLVVLGAVAIPLGLEARWRHLDHGAGFAQPEVSVIERSATYVSRGLDPYRSYIHNGHLVNAVPGVPAYQSFFPYLPLMSVFGLPSAATHRAELTDARIIMSLMTLLAAAVALAMLRATHERKVRVAQVLLALPTGALFLATGGDDMPILALLLLGVVALQRRRTWLAGASLGVAAAMKFTAWPVALGALLVAVDSTGRRRWMRVAILVAAIVALTSVPFAVRAPAAFVANVVAFPLGIAGVHSPAASPLPGHILTTLWSPLGHLIEPITLVVLGYLGLGYVRRHWPIDLPALLRVIAVGATVVILAASATRVGYVIYPLNFALWSWAVTPADVREPLLVV